MPSPLRAHLRQLIPVVTGGSATALPATAAPVAARAVAVALLALMLQRRLPTFPTRVGLR